MIRTHIIETSFLNDAETFQSYFAQMPLYRREKIGKTRLNDEKRRSLGAGILLQRSLAECGLDDSYEIAYGTYGKPYFPLIKDRFRFSLSHAGDYAFCVYSFDENGKAVSVGCDIEKIRETDYTGIMRHFHPKEREAFNALSDEEERKEMFFRLWTFKESLIKADGRGLRISLSDFCVETENDQIHALAPFDQYSFEEKHVHPLYKASCCYAKTHDPNGV